MLARCDRPATRAFRWYGARGISVCERWRDFSSFLADMGERPDGMSLDRVDSNGNYEQANCRWSSARTQGRNKRTTKLTWDLAEEIRGRCEHGESRLSVAKRMGVSKASVEKIIAGKNWSHGRASRYLQLSPRLFA